jgi:excisionase family DNA binding protein
VSDLLGVKAACAYLGDIHRATLYRIVQRGELRVQKVGGGTFFRRSELERYLKAHERGRAA